MKLELIRSGNYLAPANDNATERLKKIPDGHYAVAQITQPRDPRHHKAYFAMIRKVYENQTIFPNEYHLRKFLEMAAGHYEKAYLPNRDTGEIVTQYWPLSISYTELDQTQFRDLFEGVKDQVAVNFELDVDETLKEAKNENQARGSDNG